MIEQEIEVRTPEGTSDSMMYRSQDRRRLAGVIFLTDIGGYSSVSTRDGPAPGRRRLYRATA